MSDLNNAPKISSLIPDNAVVTWEGEVTIEGHGFDNKTTASFGGKTQSTTFVSSTLLKVQLTQAVTGSIGIKRVLVQTGTGRVSNELSFVVVPG